eukprot:4751627-Pyramimonas_sp.AAC.1
MAGAVVSSMGAQWVFTGAAVCACAILGYGCAMGVLGLYGTSARWVYWGCKMSVPWVYWSYNMGVPWVYISGL